MIEILLVLIFVMLLLLMFALFFIFGAWFGFKCLKQKKTQTVSKGLTAQETEEYKRTQKELENFMNYTGKPQDVISG